MAQTDAPDIPLDIAFHGMEPSEHIAHQIRRQAKKLDRFRDYAIQTRVVAEAAHKSSTGAQLAVKVEVSVPGAMIVGQKAGRPHKAVDNADIYGVIREAFETTVRRLEDHIGKHFEPGKGASAQAGRHATITRVDSARGYGILETETGQSLFFQASAVDGEDLGALEPGMEVTYSLADAVGAYGPEAARVQRVVGGRA